MTVTTPEASGGGNRAATLLQQGSQEVDVQHDAIALSRISCIPQSKEVKWKRYLGRTAKTP
jgi:hypothetical protein